MSLMRSIDPEVLVLPSSITNVIPPRPPGYPLDRESFARNTGVTFDPLSPAASAIQLTLDVLLNRQRAARMNVFHAAQATLPGFEVVLDALGKASWYEPRLSGMSAAIQRVKNDKVLQGQMALLADPLVTEQVRSQALASILQLDKWLSKQGKTRMDRDWAAHYARARQEIGLWLEDPSRLAPTKVKSAPPGSPIGS